MACVETFKCDSCNRMKRKEEIDWFIIYKTLTDFTVYKWSHPTAMANKTDPNFSHFCSAECGLKLIGRLIEKMQGVTKESTPADEKAVEKVHYHGPIHYHDPMLKLPDDKNFA